MMGIENKVFLTFDIDWASLKNHSLIELGIHPNFNNLLNETHSEKDAVAILDTIQSIVPDAVSVRSHSLFQSSRLYNLFRERGFEYDLNMFIPNWSGIACQPYCEVNGIVRMPYFWEDDIHAYAIEQNIEMNWDTDRFLAVKSLKVFDFHPIHVFLNMENLERYEKSRVHLRSINDLQLCVNEYNQPGTRTFLVNLISSGKKSGYEFLKISDFKI